MTSRRTSEGTCRARSRSRPLATPAPPRGSPRGRRRRPAPWCAPGSGTPGRTARRGPCRRRTRGSSRVAHRARPGSGPGRARRCECRWPPTTLRTARCRPRPRRRGGRRRGRSAPAPPDHRGWGPRRRGRRRPGRRCSRRVVSRRCPGVEAHDVESITDLGRDLRQREAQGHRAGIAGSAVVHHEHADPPRRDPGGARMSARGTCSPVGSEASTGTANVAHSNPPPHLRQRSKSAAPPRSDPFAAAVATAGVASTVVPIAPVTTIGGGRPSGTRHERHDGPDRSPSAL